MASLGMDIVKILAFLGLAAIGRRVYLSVRRERNEPRRRAAERLFQAFLDEIHDLNEGERDAAEILRQAFPKHEEAYTQFRFRLKGKDRRNFDDAWEGYSRLHLNDSPLQAGPLPAAGNGTVPREQRQRVLKEMLAFLSSAKKYSSLPLR